MAAETSGSEQRLAEFFQPPREYSDSDIRTISNLLRLLHPRWERAPRIYIILRIIGQLEHLDKFIEQEITDFRFPFDSSNTPDFLNPEACERFIEEQSKVLTETVHLEKMGDHSYLDKNQWRRFLDVKADLGKGFSSTVEKVLSKWSGEAYALKLIRRSTEDDTKRAEVELNILKRIKHEHIVELKGSFTDPDYFGLLMSPVAKWNLATYLSEALTSTDKKSLLRTYFGCLTSSLRYLHYEAKIRHKDIKPENILVEEGGNVLLTDFGISHNWSETLRTTTRGPTARTSIYCAPEVTDEEESRSSSSDIWSLGCVFLEMATVLQGNSVQEMRIYLREHGSRSSYYYKSLGAISQWMVSLRENGSRLENKPLDWISGMLKPGEGDRPNAKQLRNQILDSSSGLPVSFCGPCCSEAKSSESLGAPEGRMSLHERSSEDVRREGTQLLDLNPALELSSSYDPNSAAEAPKRLNLQEIMMALASSGKNFKDMASYKFWSTQPVPKFGEEDAQIEEGPLKIQKIEDVPKESAPLLPGFEWCTMDLLKEEELNELWELLNGHYVEDDEAMFRFNYSKSILKW
jgi:serine/threonine protein kinase